MPPAGQAELVAASRAGDEAAFTALVEELGPSMLRVARMYVSTRAVAEEVVQETWLGVLAGIDRFEGRSSLKTWIFRILTNRAKTRGEREGRSVPVLLARAATAKRRARPSTPTASSARPRWPGTGRRHRARWSELPEDRLVGKETLEVVAATRSPRCPPTPARRDHAARRRGLERRGGS